MIFHSYLSLPEGNHIKATHNPLVFPGFSAPWGPMAFLFPGRGAGAQARGHPSPPSSRDRLGASEQRGGVTEGDHGGWEMGI